MMSNQEIHLDEGPNVDFKGATLQMHEEGGKTNNGVVGNINDNINGTVLNENEGRSSEVAVVPWSGQDVRSFFSHRDDIIEKALQDCSNQVITEEDGDLLGTWLLTEISYWDNEKERLVLLSSNYVITVKYDLIALKTLEVRRVPLEKIDTIIIGDLAYPPNSLIPRIDGLITGVSGVVGGLMRPLQEKLSPSFHQDNNANPFVISNFEPRSRNMRGVRAMWNQGEPLNFTKKWNPFSNDIPWNTYTSHPLLWHKEGNDKERSIYNVDDFAYRLVQAVEKFVRSVPCSIQHKSIVFDNYVGLSSLIHNKNSLGFFKIRGKFSF
uniref:HSac2 domain-containing protein n=2 Tax=Clastoptera arizonana TaxID=38151 RepID=A0A1B6CE73_9HEMI